MKMDISDNLVKKIIDVLTSYKKLEKIVIFGSRAKGSSKAASDIDIAVFGRDWTDTDINLAKHRIEETIKTPLKFDLLNYFSLSKEKLKKDIMEHGKVIYGN
jgi:predicted nucleotidyltransferase